MGIRFCEIVPSHRSSSGLHAVVDDGGYITRREYMRQALFCHQGTSNYFEIQAQICEMKVDRLLSGPFTGMRPDVRVNNNVDRK